MPRKELEGNSARYLRLQKRFPKPKAWKAMTRQDIYFATWYINRGFFKRETGYIITAKREKLKEKKGA